MHETYGRRQLRRHFVMIGDDQFETEVSRERRFLDAANAAIDGDDQPLRVFLVKLPHRVAVQAIALFQAMRDVVIDRRIREPQAVPKNTRRGDAIDVVVAVDRDPPPRLHRRDDTIGRFGKIRHQVRFVQSHQARLQKRLRRRVARVSASDQHLRDQRGQFQLPRQFTHGGGIMRGKPPRLRHQEAPSKLRDVEAELQQSRERRGRIKALVSRTGIPRSHKTAPPAPSDHATLRE